jgi:hypothetical protein
MLGVSGEIHHGDTEATEGARSLFDGMNWVQGDRRDLKVRIT